MYGFASGISGFCERSPPFIHQALRTSIQSSGDLPSHARVESLRCPSCLLLQQTVELGEETHNREKEKETERNRERQRERDSESERQRETVSERDRER